jgi:hypothetical protein
VRPIPISLRWDGKDSLLSADNPKWKLSAKLAGSGQAQPQVNFSEPLLGRFSLLITPRPEWQVGQRLKFEVIARGPQGRELFATFVADVQERPQPVEKPQKGPRLVEGDFKTGAMRRPPYELKIITRDQYQQACWNKTEWTDDDSGAFVKPTDRAPLFLIINEDFEAIRDFKRALTKRNTEQDVQRKVNKYTSHVAFHLYQMYQATIGKKDKDVDAADAARRDEIRRVALTMIKLMDVAEK